MKTCTKCRVEKEEGCFYKTKASKDGLTCWCKECQKEYMKEYCADPEVKKNRKEYLKEYHADPGVKKHKKEYMKEYMKEYYADPEVKKNRKEYHKEYHADPGVKKHTKEYMKARMVSDDLYRITRSLRSLIYHSIENHGYSKKSKTFQLLGADYETVRKHLEDTWFQNYGTLYVGQEVHIDHIIPCSSAKTEEELIALQHYTNLQYLTPEDNLSKGDRC